MRALPWIVAALVAVPAVAHADDDTTDDEDGEFVPLPKRSVGFGLAVHGSRIGGESESGLGPAVELGLGRDRWQYVGEVSLATSSRTVPDPTALDNKGSVGGRMVHGAFGVRWLARQFRPDNGGGVELFLLSMIGAQRFYFSDGGRLSRPELAAGFGMQFRSFRRPRIAFRLDARVVFTPSDRESSIVRCAGSCSMETGASTGFQSGFGFAW